VVAGNTTEMEGNFSNRKRAGNMKKAVRDGPDQCISFTQQAVSNFFCAGQKKQKKLEC
jgi:hypothetical protein